MNGEYVDDWRPPVVEYEVPDELRLPWQKFQPGGSHWTLCEDLVCKIEEHILRGASVDAARVLVGVRARTWRDWVKGNREGREPYVTVFQRFAMAKAHKEVSALRIIRAAGEVADADTAVKASKLTLEYTRPEKYAPQRNVKVDVRTTLSVDDAALARLATTLGVMGNQRIGQYVDTTLAPPPVTLAAIAAAGVPVDADVDADPAD